VVAEHLWLKDDTIRDFRRTMLRLPRPPRVDPSHVRPDLRLTRAAEGTASDVARVAISYERRHTQLELDTKASNMLLLAEIVHEAKGGDWPKGRLILN